MKFPGIPRDVVEDRRFLGGVPEVELDALVAECAILSGDPFFFTRVVDSMIWTYERWEGSGVPFPVQCAAAALRRIHAERGEGAAEEAWFRAIEGAFLFEESAA
jgi:hypothetical protein